MAWVFLVHGKTVYVGNCSPYDLERSLEKNESFKKIEERAKSAGFDINFASNTNGPVELAIIVGKELYPNRHIYTGLTVTQPLAPDLDEAALDALVGEVVALLAQDTSLTVEVASGIVLSQFD